MSRTNTVCLGILLAIGGGRADADDYHYNNMLIGHRASGLGGAYTAISDDPSGLYYNPAGIVYAGATNFSASVNAFHRTQYDYRDVVGGSDWSRESSTLLPNFFGVTQPLGNGVVGFSYAVPDSILENQDQLLRNVSGSPIDTYIININNEDNTYKLGPSYAISLSDSLSIGATLYAHIRSTETIFSQVITLTNEQYEWTTSYLQSEESGIEPIIGLMWSPFERLAIGMSVRQTFVLSSHTDLQNVCATDITTSACERKDQHPSTQLSQFDTERVYPLQIALGMAYFPNNRLLLSADFSYYAQAGGAVNSYIDSPFRTKETTWNASAGVEYYVSDHWALRAGVFTNRANTPALESGRTGQADHVDLLGLAASVSRFTRSSSLSFGLAYTSGEGEAQAVQGIDDIQNLEVNTLTLFLSTSYTY